ncbi:MAG: Coenzyme F420:L-glutamate ligase [Syntrophorhabdaceae bacterium PtaU1.Bin034]|nr:MAG: Coenzyme F420:L-glutamate ligase [Syntrophorhabdaceae bacterium PtaU1.Bin034]
MNYSELLTKRRSVRDYEDREVPLETLMEIINESCLAPSSSDRQPWHFIIVTNRDVIKRLSDESKGNLLHELERNPGFMSSNYETILRDPQFNVFYNAPCLVFITGPKTLPSIQADCALAASYFMFSACTKGLATCWIGLGRFINDRELLDLIGMLESDVIVAPLIIGYPKRIPGVPNRMGPEVLKIVS